MALLVVVVLGCAWVGDWLFTALVCGIAFASAWELWDAARQPHKKNLLSFRFGLLAVLSLPILAWRSGFNGFITLASVALILVILVAIFSPSSNGRQFARSLALGLIYIGVPSAMIILLRTEGGFGATVFYLAVVQLADLGAFLGGKRWGRRSLAPLLSPGKTWEGLLAGATAACSGALLFGYAVPGWSPIELVLIGLILTATGLLGDLFASCLKRLRGIKDFGSLLPGHGGVIDRFDSYFFCAPVAWWLFVNPISTGETMLGRSMPPALLTVGLAVTVVLLVLGVWLMNRAVTQRLTSSDAGSN